MLFKITSILFLSVSKLEPDKVTVVFKEGLADVTSIEVIVGWLSLVAKA